VKVLQVLLVLLLSTVESKSQQSQCMQTEFSGEVSQGQKFSQQLGEGIRFSVLPMSLKEDPRWGWFQIRVLNEQRPIVVFNPSDSNWLLATDWSSAFIGGVNST